MVGISDIKACMIAKVAKKNLKFQMIKRALHLLFQGSSDRRKIWLSIIFLFVIQIIFASFGYEGRKLMQVSILLIPALLLMLIPIKDGKINLIRSVLVWAGVLIFLLDSAVRAHLISLYGAAPDSTMVISAVANTNSAEVGSYLTTHIRDFGASTIIFMIAAGVVLWLSLKGVRKKSRFSKFELIAISLILLISSVSYVSKPWRKINPVIFWSDFSKSVKVTKKSWESYEKERLASFGAAKDESPSIQRDGKSTIVLVITESINRDNMSIYGYKRNTTPMLDNLQNELGDRFLVVRNSWSTEATTIPAIDSMLNFSQVESEKKLNLIALAKTAGYKTWWISNHDDIAINQKHASMADVVYMENNKPGRSSVSLDEVLLPSYESALDDPFPQKFIVLHMLGAHPHYRLRFPENQKKFQDDEISKMMSAKGRSMWVRDFRNDYDSAIFYQDSVVSSVFEKLRKPLVIEEEYRSILYVSDHGQEVGHQTNKVGHSPSTESGYKIPAIIWTMGSADAVSRKISERPFRADWLAWTMADLMALKWRSYDSSRSFISKNYSWINPRIPTTKSINDD